MTPPPTPSSRRSPFGGIRRVVATVGPALLVLALGVAVYDAVVRLRASRALVGRTREVIATSRHTRSALQDLETGQRGFIITGEERYLEPFHAGRAALDDDTAALRALMRGDAAQQRRLDALAPLVAARAALLDSGIALRRAGRTDAAVAVVRGGRGRLLMDSARLVLEAVEAEERRLLEVNLAREDRHARLLLWVVIGGTVLAGALALWTNALLARLTAREAEDARTLAEQVEQLEAQQVELEAQQVELEAQQAELEAQQVELEQQQAELEEANADLVAANEQVEAQRAAAVVARAEAEAANLAKSQFLATMSHELRTPLNAIQGYVQLLEMGLHGSVNAEQHEALRRVDLAQRHLLGLINDILNLARIESGRVEYDIRPLALGDLLADVAPLIEPQLAGRGLAYEVRLTDPALEVWADREKARQVLLNLLANAGKFTEAGGRVTVDSVEPRGAPDLVQLRVLDTGRGIPEDQLERIFAPFVQLHRGLARPGEGTGLGLAISRDLARGMGGDLTAASCANGDPTGSIFTFTLRRVVSVVGEPTDRRTQAERRTTEEERRADENRRRDGDDSLMLDAPGAETTLADDSLR